MGMAAILVMWPKPFYQSFIDLSCAGLTWNMTSIGPAVSKEKQSFYLTPSTNFHIIDYNTFVLPFLIQKPKGPNLALLENESRSTQCQHFSELANTQVPDAKSQVSSPSACLFWRRKYLKIFTIYGHDGHLGHVSLTILSKFHWHIQCRLNMKYDFNWPSGFWGKEVIFCLTDLKPRSSNDLGLWHTLWFVYSFTWLHPPASHDRLQYFCFTLFSSKSLKDQVWPSCKIGQGQSRVIILANLRTLKYLMQNATNFKKISPLVLEKKIFEVLFPT